MSQLLHGAHSDLGLLMGITTVVFFSALVGWTIWRSRLGIEQSSNKPAACRSKPTTSASRRGGVMSQITDELMGHAEDNDGIEEYDNPLPQWWLWLFYLTIVWGVFYAVNYHVLAEDGQLRRYDREMADAAERWPQSDEAVAVVMDEASIAEGREVFVTTCASCHAADGTGGIGPSPRGCRVDPRCRARAGARDSCQRRHRQGHAGVGPRHRSEKVAKVVAYVVDLHAKSGAGVVDVDPSEAPAAAATPVADLADPDADPLVAGKVIWDQYCVACHGPDGEGTVTAPSLVDEEWLHGRDLEQIVQVIRAGVEGKAMVAWEPIVGEVGVNHVATFVHHRATEAGQ